MEHTVSAVWRNGIASDYDSARIRRLQVRALSRSIFCFSTCAHQWNPVPYTFSLDTLRIYLTVSLLRKHNTNVTLPEQMQLFMEYFMLLDASLVGDERNHVVSHVSILRRVRSQILSAQYRPPSAQTVRHIFETCLSFQTTNNYLGSSPSLVAALQLHISHPSQAVGPQSFTPFTAASCGHPIPSVWDQISW